MITGWRRWARIWRRTPEVDVEAELRFHLEARIEDLVAAGEAPETARAHALEEFGDLGAVRSELLAIDHRMVGHRRRAEWCESVWLDARHVGRGLARSPGFTIMVAATLALGIGANTVMFSLLDRLFFRTPAGVTHAERVRWLRYTTTDRLTHAPYTRDVFDYPEAWAVTAAAPSGTSVAAYERFAVSLGSDARSPVATAAFVAGDYFDVLGVHPAAGRFFTPDEQRPSGLTPVAVIGYDMWMTNFAGRRDVLGQPLQLGDDRYTIVGVAPEGFTGVELDPAQLWIPFNAMDLGAGWAARPANWYESPNCYCVSVLARLPEGSDGQAFTAGATNALSTQQHGAAGTASLASLNGAPGEAQHSAEFGISRRLGGVALIILLIACANVTSLLLIRALGRRREIAVRLALGVSRRRLAGQFVMEAVIVAVIGGAAALLLAWWGGSVLRTLLLPRVSWTGAAVTTRVLLFTVAITLASGITAGFVAAMQGSHPRLIEALKGGLHEGRASRSRTRTALLLVQAALSVVLLAGAGLFVRSLRQVEGIDLGYDRNHILVASPLPVGGDSARSRQLTDGLADAAARLRHLPGVEQVALASMGPMGGSSGMNVFVPGRDSALTGGAFWAPSGTSVSPEYFSTVGMRVERGRAFTAADRAGSERVAVVNETMARSYWPGGKAIGGCLMLGTRDAPCRRIVGVVADAHAIQVIEEPSSAYLLPLAQAGEPKVIVIRTRQDADGAAIAAVTRDLGSAFPFPVVAHVRTMSDALSRQYRNWQLGATLFTACGLLALLVAAVGIYSTIAYTAGQRRREIGVRLALGAQGTQVARLVIAQGLRVVLVGIVIGVAAVFALGRLVASLLYGVTPHDPLVLTAVALVLILVAIAACAVPAWRAARVDPMETLRTE